MSATSRIAHFNVARLLHEPKDPRVAEFVDNTIKVNGIAMRSKGYVWHLADDSAQVTNPEYAGHEGDSQLAYSMSVWETLQDLQTFVHQTVHGTFLKRRALWFEPWSGPNYVVWNFVGEPPIQLEEGWSRLRLLAEHGPTAKAYDFEFAKARSKLSSQ